VVGNLLAGASVVATWLIFAAAIITLIVIGFAALLLFTGKWIEHHAKWARVLGLLISLTNSFSFARIDERDSVPFGPGAVFDRSRIVLCILGIGLEIRRPKLKQRNR
jgi:hypothetical protein